MMNPIVYALADAAIKDTVGETFGERAGVAGSVTLLGMVAIFAVLSILWGVIELLHRVLSRGGQSDAPKSAEPAPAPVRSEERAVKAAPAERATEKKENDELIAVITAAVAAAMEEEGCTGGFRVVSFRRTQNRRSGR